nr:hypothetical protein [Candidatus Methylospira mobilis]
MPGIADQLVAPKVPWVVGNDLTVRHHAYAIRGGTNGYCLIGPLRWDAVAITFNTDQALAANAAHLFHITIKHGFDWHQQGLLFSKAIRNGA